MKPNKMLLMEQHKLQRCIQLIYYGIKSSDPQNDLCICDEHQIENIIKEVAINHEGKTMKIKFELTVSIANEINSPLSVPSQSGGLGRDRSNKRILDDVNTKIPSGKTSVNTKIPSGKTSKDNIKNGRRSGIMGSNLSTTSGRKRFTIKEE